MKKILILVSSILVFSDALSETYVCATPCWRANEVCQMTYTRDKQGFIEGDSEYMIDFGEDTGIIETLFPHVSENDDFLALTKLNVAPFMERGSNPAGFASAVSVLIDKRTLRYTQINSFLPAKINSKASHTNRAGKCIRIE